MATTAQWIKEAEENAKKYSETIKKNNQYLIDELIKAKDNSLSQLQQQQDNAIYKLNANKSTINQSAEDAAKQLYINKMLALRDNQSSMNRAGLGTQGVVGSQVNSINNNYGTNLTEVLKNKISNLNNLEIQKNDTNTSYDTSRINLLTDYGKNLANLQSEIDDKALNQYNTVYNNYLAMKQQEYENEQAELAKQEAIRQYNENLAFQREKAKQSQANWEKEYALNKYQTYLGGSGGSGFGDGSSDNSENKSSETQSKYANPFTKTVNPDTANGVFDNGYQPDNINGQKLKKSGQTVAQFIGEKGSLNSGNVSIDDQNVWKIGNKYYAWDGYANEYIDITSYKKSSKTMSSSAGNGGGNSGGRAFGNTTTNSKYGNYTNRRYDTNATRNSNVGNFTNRRYDR